MSADSWRKFRHQVDAADESEEGRQAWFRSMWEGDAEQRDVQPESAADERGMTKKTLQQITTMTTLETTLMSLRKVVRTVTTLETLTKRKMRLHSRLSPNNHRLLPYHPPLMC